MSNLPELNSLWFSVVKWRNPVFKMHLTRAGALNALTRLGSDYKSYQGGQIYKIVNNAWYLVANVPEDTDRIEWERVKNEIKRTEDLISNKEL